MVCEPSISIFLTKAVFVHHHHSPSRFRKQKFEESRSRSRSRPQRMESVDRETVECQNAALVKKNEIDGTHTIVCAWTLPTQRNSNEVLERALRRTRGTRRLGLRSRSTQFMGLFSNQHPSPRNPNRTVKPSVVLLVLHPSYRDTQS